MRKPPLWLLAVAALAVIGFMAFRGDTGQVLKSRRGRDVTPSASAAARERAAAGNTEFALRLHQHLRTEEGNLFFSPYSLSLGLAMTHAGARGEMEQQMVQAPELDEDWLFAVQELRKVRRDGTVSYRNIGCGVPAEYIGDHVWLHLVDSKVVITHAGKTIAEHPLTV